MRSAQLLRPLPAVEALSSAPSGLALAAHKTSPLAWSTGLLAARLAASALPLPAISFPAPPKSPSDLKQIASKGAQDRT